MSVEEVYSKLKEDGYDDNDILQAVNAYKQKEFDSELARRTVENNKQPQLDSLVGYYAIGKKISNTVTK